MSVKENSDFFELSYPSVDMEDKVQFETSQVKTY